MRRSIIAILAMGILAVAALGLGASYLLDQSPEIQRVAHFKASALEDLSLSSIDVRIVPRRGERIVRIAAQLSAPPRERSAAEGLAHDLACRLVEDAGEHLPAEIVQVDLLQEGRWGCRDAETLHAFAWAAVGLRGSVEFRRSRGELASVLGRQDPPVEGSVEAKEEGGRRIVTVRLADPRLFEEGKLRPILALARSSFSRAPYREIRFADARGEVRARYSFSGQPLQPDAPAAGTTAGAAPAGGAR